MNFVTSTILPTGWHYNDKDGYRIPRKGELPNAQSVIDAIMNHRLENNLPVGNPEADLEEYVCSKFPTWCRRATNFIPPPNKQPNRRNVDLIAEWANTLFTKIGRPGLVPQSEAEARANICSTCPARMEWARDCAPCVTSAQRILTMLRQGRDTAQGAATQGCMLHAWDNRTAVHLDKAFLPPQSHPGAPAHCWMRR